MIVFHLALLSSALLAQPAAIVDRIFAQWSNPGSPGCAVGVWKNGKAELMRGYGMANLEHSIPNTPQTTFYLASTSKEFTAAALLMLVERGAVKLDDSVRKWIPEMPEYAQPVLVRHLLEHTSGIRDYIGLWTLTAPADDASLDNKRVMRLILQQKELNFAPGTQFLYSNSNYVLLAEVMQRIRAPLPLFARDNVFGPLGMGNTFYGTDRFGLVPKRASGYAPGGGRYRIAASTVDVIGDGGVYSTVEDVMRWFQAIEKPAAPFVKALTAMQKPAKLNTGEEAEYGFGLMIKKHRGLTVWDHVGGLNGYRTDILYIPSEKLGVACLCNTSEASTGKLARQVADAYLGNRPEPAPPQLPPGALDRKTGMFRDRDSGDFLYLVQQNGQLMGQFQSFNITLIPETPMRFRTSNSPVDLTLEFRDGGDRDEPSFLRVESEIHKPLAVDRVQASSRPEDMNQFEGSYLAHEIPAHARIVYSPDAGGLGLYQEETRIGTLGFLGPDKFQVGVLNVEFVRDGAGKVSGFRLNTGRVRRLLYQKVGAP
jgi:CubicO group peptidase (beta-lactamase class C family)